MSKTVFSMGFFGPKECKKLGKISNKLLLSLFANPKARPRIGTIIALNKKIKK